jgi:hypothetical protein
MDEQEPMNGEDNEDNLEATTSLLDRFTKALRAANARKSRKETYFGPK